MVERKNLVAVGPEQPVENAVEAADAAAIETQSEEYLMEDEPVRRLGRFDWVVPALAVTVVIGWTGFFGWVHREALLAGANLDAGYNLFGTVTSPQRKQGDNPLLALRAEVRECL